MHGSRLEDFLQFLVWRSELPHLDVFNALPRLFCTQATAPDERSR